MRYTVQASKTGNAWFIRGEFPTYDQAKVCVFDQFMELIGPAIVVENHINTETYKKWFAYSTQGSATDSFYVELHIAD